MRGNSSPIITYFKNSVSRFNPISQNNTLLYLTGKEPPKNYRKKLALKFSVPFRMS